MLLGRLCRLGGGLSLCGGKERLTVCEAHAVPDLAVGVLEVGRAPRAAPTVFAHAVPEVVVRVLDHRVVALALHREVGLDGVLLGQACGGGSGGGAVDEGAEGDARAVDLVLGVDAAVDLDDRACSGGGGLGGVGRVAHGRAPVVAARFTAFLRTGLAGMVLV